MKLCSFLCDICVYVCDRFIIDFDESRRQALRSFVLCFVHCMCHSVDFNDHIVAASDCTPVNFVSLYHCRCGYCGIMTCSTHVVIHIVSIMHRVVSWAVRSQLYGLRYVIELK